MCVSADSGINPFTTLFSPRARQPTRSGHCGRLAARGLLFTRHPLPPRQPTSS